MDEKSHLRILFVVIVLLSTYVGPAFAQQKTARKIVTKPGVLSGRGFAITAGGDIKPARMADVYLLYECHGKMPEADKEYQGTAGGMPFMDQELKRLTEYTQWLEENGRDLSESLVCRRELLSYDSFVVQMMTWAKDQNKMWQVIIDQADEEGTFKTSVPHPGRYRLLIRGKAGLNEAFWNADVVVNSGEETTVKLSAPNKACLTIE